MHSKIFGTQYKYGITYAMLLKRAEELRPKYLVADAKIRWIFLGAHFIKMCMEICPVSYFLFRCAFSHLWWVRSAYRIESDGELVEMQNVIRNRADSLLNTTCV